MERYKDNGICNYIEKAVNKGVKTDLKFYDIEKSLLVVANKKDNVPIALFVDDRCENPDRELTPEEKQYGNICFSLAKQANLPLFWIKYVDVPVLKNEDEVYIWDASNGPKFDKLKMKEIVDLLKKHNIQCESEDKSPRKEKNDSLSSAFHLWQRECLKVGVFADIDLIRIVNKEVKEIIELKRSFYSLENWRPFYFDINNFSIIFNLCKRLGNVPFKIIYNSQVKNIPELEKGKDIYFKTIKQQTGEICYDKIDKIKVFDVEEKEKVYYYPLPYPVFKEIIPVRSFL